MLVLNEDVQGSKIDQIVSFIYRLLIFFAFISTFSTLSGREKTWMKCNVLYVLLYVILCNYHKLVYSDGLIPPSPYCISRLICITVHTNFLFSRFLSLSPLSFHGDNSTFGLVISPEKNQFKLRFVCFYYIFQAKYINRSLNVLGFYFFIE